MKSARAKNIIIIVLVSAIAAAIIGGSVYVAVENNSRNGQVDFFFDSAPADYSSAENFAYANLFREAVANYLKPLSDKIDFYGFADKLVRTASVTRISAETLGKCAAAIKKHNINDVLNGIKIEDMTDEELEELFKTSGFTLIKNIVGGFFSESGLTGSEAGNFIWNYAFLYGTEEQRNAFNAIGQDNFVGFSALSFNLISNFSDGNASSFDGFTVKSIIYELGARLFKVSAGGADAVEKAFGLQWSREEGEYAAAFNGFTAGISGKIGLLFPLFGFILKEIDVETSDYASEYAETGEENALILSRMGLSAAILRGADIFISRYGEQFGAENMEELKLQVVNLVKNIYCARMVSAGFPPETLEQKEIVDILNAAEKDVVEFFNAVEFLGKADKSAINAEYIEKVKNMDGILRQAEEVTASVIYLWTAQRMHNLEKEIK